MSSEHNIINKKNHEYSPKNQLNSLPVIPTGLTTINEFSENESSVDTSKMTLQASNIFDEQRE